MSPEHPRHQVKVPEKVLEEIMEVRDTGQTNMLDRGTVQVVADSLGFYSLVNWIEENRQDYRRGIMRGFTVTDSGGS